MSKEITIYYVKWWDWDYNDEQPIPMISAYYDSFQEAKEKYDSLECNEDNPQIEIRKKTMSGWETLDDVRVLMKESMEYGVEETIGE